MKGEFKQLMKDYFSFTRSEQRGMVILAFILLFSIMLYITADIFDFSRPISETEKKQFQKWAQQQESPEEIRQLRLFPFDPNTISEALLDSLDIPPEIKNNLIRYRKKGGEIRKPDDFRKLYGMTDTIFTSVLPYITLPMAKSRESVAKSQVPGTQLFNFDPNKVSENELTKLGFSNFQKNNLLKYRKNGGKFAKKADLLKVFGIDSDFYMKITDHIQLDDFPDRSAKKPEMILTELNQADSASLVRLPGIGAFFAGRIIRYRNILGGYYSVRQLMEVYGMTDEKVMQFQHLVYADSLLVQPVRLNFADEKSLDRHPYISRQQATQIIDLRSSQGPFQNREELLEKGIFDKAAFDKVKHYVTCR